ncbi:DUF5320 domain-containing protein [Candidatus Woesearchaeota archaeon]|nr:DUF5320 domain-containing protein [Candidatus Woesearchaeota archaeon]
MPNKDGTGPEGKEAKTGRQMGRCEGAAPDIIVGGPLGRRDGRGCGCRQIRRFRGRGN